MQLSKEYLSKLYVTRGMSPYEISRVVNRDFPFVVLKLVEFGLMSQEDARPILTDGSVPFEADQSMGGYRISDVADPVEAYDVVPLAYFLSHQN